MRQRSVVYKNTEIYFTCVIRPIGRKDSSVEQSSIAIENLLNRDKFKWLLIYGAATQKIWSKW